MASSDADGGGKSKDDAVRAIATAWCYMPSGLPAPERLAEIAAIFYLYRNPPTDENSEEYRRWRTYFDNLPAGTLSADDEVVAAVEHYFFSRSQVARGEYSSANMSAFIHIYQLAKRTGLDLRHNKNNPTTAPSDLQQTWALLGAAQGKQDLATANEQAKAANKPQISPPIFRLPPNFTGSYGGKKLDQIKYGGGTR